MANRELTSAMKAELVANRTSPVIIYEGEFVGFTLRLWTGISDLSWDGKVFLGNGMLS